MSVACTVDDVSPDRKIRLRREYNSDSLSKLISRVMHLGPEDMKLFYDLCENPPPLSDYFKKGFLEYIGSLK